MHPLSPAPRRRRDMRRADHRPSSTITAATPPSQPTPPALARELAAGLLRPDHAPTRRSEHERPELRAFHARLEALAERNAPRHPSDATGAHALPIACPATRSDSPR